jgi:hypothetical protein
MARPKNKKGQCQVEKQGRTQTPKQGSKDEGRRQEQDKARQFKYTSKGQQLEHTHEL